MLEVTAGRLIAHPHPETRGLLEVRGLGLLPFAVCEAAPVTLVLLLDEQAPRFVEIARTVAMLGLPVPMLRLKPGSAVLHLQAELALARYGLA